MLNSFDIILKNIINLIDASGITENHFAEMMNLSIRKWRYIKKGRVDLKLSDIEKIGNFFSVSVSQLSSTNFKVRNDLRHFLLQKYKNNTEYRTHLETKPSLMFAIRYVLLNYPGFIEPMEIRDIQKYFKTFNWEFSSSSISNAMIRIREDINIQPHASKNKTFIYYAKKLAKN